MLNMRVLLGLSLTVLLAQAAGASVVTLKGSSGVCKNDKSISPANPQGIIGLGNIDGSGNFSMTILNPDDGTVSPPRTSCGSIPRTGPSASPTPIVFSGTLPAKYSTLHAIRAGTKGVAECLKQGSNLSGIGEVAGSSLTSGIYTLTFKYTFNNATDDGCVFGAEPPQWITPDGQPNFNHSRSATLAGGTQTFTGAYHLYDATTVVPEPGSLALLLAGAAAAVGLNLLSRRRKAARD